MGAESDVPGRLAIEGHSVTRAPTRHGPPDALPVDALPVDVDPVDALPVDVDPVDVDPVDALPVDGDPAGVVVVDDHAGFRAAVRTMLELDGRCRVSGEASSVAAALDLLDTLPRAAELVLLDVNLGEIDGMRGAAMVVARHPTVPVLLCSTAPRHELPPMPALPGVSFVPKELLDGDVVWEAVQRARGH